MTKEDKTKAIPVEGLKETDFELYSQVKDYSKIFDYNIFMRVLIVDFPKKYDHLLLAKKHEEIIGFKETQPGTFIISVRSLTSGNFIMKGK